MDISPRYFTLNQLANYSSLSVTSLRRYIKNEGLPHFKMNKRVLVQGWWVWSVDGKAQEKEGDKERRSWSDCRRGVKGFSSLLFGENDWFPKSDKLIWWATFGLHFFDFGWNYWKYFDYWTDQNLMLPAEINGKCQDISKLSFSTFSYS